MRLRIACSTRSKAKFMAKQGPQVVHDSAVGTVADIVFVRGLRGDAIDTWSKDGVCWPRDLLPQDLPYTRIITWGYDSTVANIKSFTSHNSIFGHAQNLLSDIARIRRDRHLVSTVADQNTMANV